MFNLSPFITALFAYMFFSEQMTVRKWTGLLVGFTGSLPVLDCANAYIRTCGREIFLFVGSGDLSFNFCHCGVYGWIVMKKLVVNKHYSPIFVNGVGMFFGGIAAFITSFLIEKKPLLKCAPGSTNISLSSTSIPASWFCFSWSDFFMFMGYVLLLILVANIIFYNFYGFLLKKYTPTFLSLVGLLCPLFTAFLGWVFLGETVTWIFFCFAGCCHGRRLYIL